MGMYTEIYVNIDLIEDVPQQVIDTLKAICEHDCKSPLLKDKPARWTGLFSNGSYYTPNTSCAKLTFDEISNRWSLLGKGDIKNYENEIEQFFDWIRPYSNSEFMGYMRYEEFDEPTLVYRSR